MRSTHLKNLVGPAWRAPAVGLALALVLAWALGSRGVAEEDGDHAGHDHAAEARTIPRPAGDPGESHDDHEDHAEEGAGSGTHDDHDDHEDHGETDGHDDHEDEGLLVLSPEELRNAGISFATAGPGVLRTEISMPGEVALNEDRVTHVVPLVPGIAAEVKVAVGDVVEPGQVLAVLQSSELAEAKLDYLTKANEALCCSLPVPRARTVRENTAALLAFLDTEPSLEKLREFRPGEVGDNLKELLGTYAETVASGRTLEREADLFEKKIASEQDYLAAKTQAGKASAEYRAARDSIAFRTRRDLSEAESQLRAAEFAAATAKRRLGIMGVTEEEIRELDSLLRSSEPCTDAECVGCEPGPDGDGRERFFGNGFARFEVRAPAAGTVVERHLVKGEKVTDDADLFTIADTAALWVNLTVHLKDLDAVRAGDAVVIRAEHSGRKAAAEIAMVSPAVDPETRTATARVVLDNREGLWRPGVFVVGYVGTAAERLPVVVPKNAVQTIEGRPAVFVRDGEGFRPQPVILGRSDRERVEIRSGLEAGAEFVAAGAFALKAKQVTSALGSHAGHGH